MFIVDILMKHWSNSLEGPSVPLKVRAHVLLLPPACSPVGKLTTWPLAAALSGHFPRSQGTREALAEIATQSSWELGLASVAVS